LRPEEAPRPFEAVEALHRELQEYLRADEHEALDE
jgi:hypothetical protein